MRCLVARRLYVPYKLCLSAVEVDCVIATDRLADSWGVHLPSGTEARDLRNKYLHNVAPFSISTGEIRWRLSRLFAAKLRSLALRDGTCGVRDYPPAFCAACYCVPTSVSNAALPITYRFLTGSAIPGR